MLLDIGAPSPTRSLTQTPPKSKSLLETTLNHSTDHSAVRGIVLNLGVLQSCCQGVEVAKSAADASPPPEGRRQAMPVLLLDRNSTLHQSTEGLGLRVFCK